MNNTNSIYKFKLRELEIILASVSASIKEEYDYPYNKITHKLEKRRKENLDIIIALEPKIRAAIAQFNIRQVIVHLSENEASAVFDSLFEEFNRNGLKDDDEPNSYGLEVESIIDKMNHPVESSS
jgi:hypothetical protein